MTRKPLILLSLLSFGCVQIPEAQGTRPAQDKDMDIADSRQDLDTSDLGRPDADMRQTPDLTDDMNTNMADMSDMPPLLMCKDQRKHFIGERATADDPCIPTGCLPGFADQNKDLNNADTDGCECPQSTEEDMPGDGDDSNCDGVDGDITKAIFVSPDGDDTRDGLTPQTALKTLGKARDVANMNSTREYILIAQGQYTSVNFELLNGVSLYGGCDTVNWLCASAPSTTTVIGGANEQSSPTLLAQNLTKPTTVQGLTLIGPTHTGKVGRTAYTVRALNNMAPLSFVKCHIQGGTGADGMDGNDGTPGPQGTPAMGVNGGTSPCGANGGAGGAAVNACANNTSGTLRPGTNGAAGMSSSAELGMGGEQGANDCTQNTLNCDNGLNGQPGTPGGNGAHGAASMLMSPAVFTPVGLFQAPIIAQGGDGEHAAGGGGGGAGGASVDSSSGTPGAGGGGGAGGCGGTAATPGQSGGSSIALIALKADLQFTDTTIGLGRSGNGGKGGRGGVGTLGLNGAGGGSATGNGGLVCTVPVPHGDGGQGGKGGDGGDGASGMGGCAGSLYGVVLDASSTFNTNSTLKATGGMPGNAGQGGAAPSNRSPAGAPGCVGVRQEDLLERI